MIGILAVSAMHKKILMNTTQYRTPKPDNQTTSNGYQPPNNTQMGNPIVKQEAGIPHRTCGIDGKN